MQNPTLIEWLSRRRWATDVVMAPLFVLLVAGVYVLVYATGGIKYVYSHSMYIPILLSGFVFGVRGGVVFGILGGLVLGPYMPVDVETGEMQETINWLYRTFFFALIGFLSGAARDCAKSYIDRLEWVSHHDTYTELPNRRALFERLSGIAGKTGVSGFRAMAVISLENAMTLKSAFGYPVIEDVVRQIALHLEKNAGKGEIYHTATAQITVLADQGREEADILTETLLGLSREPVQFNDIPVHVDTRMGIVWFDQSGASPEEYLKRAEAALVAAQEQGREQVAYGPEIRRIAEENLVILGGLKNAIKDEKLTLYYQPKVLFSTGEVHGAEALIRWHHPEQGVIRPEAFIPRAEKSALIHVITGFVLERAVKQMVLWRERGIHVPIAVNISTRNLLQPGFVDLVKGLLDQHDLDHEMLELEVTEGALMIDMDRTIVELSRLNKLKIVVSIDDFGTGYSSLQYLHRLPISFIKVDQSFVRRVTVDNGAVHIVEAAVMLAHKMGIKTIAEGVENMEVYDFLCSVGCDIAQGNMISRPLPVDEFEKWHEQYQSIQPCKT